MGKPALCLVSVSCLSSRWRSRLLTGQARFTQYLSLIRSYGTFSLTHLSSEQLVIVILTTAWYRIGSEESLWNSEANVWRKHGVTYKFVAICMN